VFACDATMVRCEQEPRFLACFGMTSLKADQHEKQSLIAISVPARIESSIQPRLFL
jgi:hypothetical protein